MATDKHQIIATPKDRFFLSRFLLRDGLPGFNSRTAQKVLKRTKRALGLDVPMNMMLNDRRPGSVELALDLTPSLFEVTPEIVELITRCIDKVEKPPVTAAELTNLEPILEQLEDQQLAAETVAGYPDAKPLDPEEEDWSPSAAPIVQKPGKLVDVLAEIIRRHMPDPALEPAWAGFAAEFLEESETPKSSEDGRKGRGGRLQDETSQPPQAEA